MLLDPQGVTNSAAEARSLKKKRRDLNTAVEKSGLKLGNSGLALFQAEDLRVSVIRIAFPIGFMTSIIIVRGGRSEGGERVVTGSSSVLELRSRARGFVGCCRTTQIPRTY